MYTIYIRASCKSKNGLGHIMRCINLSTEFINNDFKVVFLIDNNEIAINLLNTKNYNYEIVNNNTFNYEIKYTIFSKKPLKLKYSLNSIISYKFKNTYFLNNNQNTYTPLTIELHTIKNIITDKHKSIILTDSYWMSNDYLNLLKTICKYLISIDDLNLYDYPSNIVINSNIYASDLDYNYKKDTLYLLGTEYTILRNEFVNECNFVVNKYIKNVLITMGGIDINNFTPVIIDYLKDIDNLTLNVVIGPGFRNIQYLYDKYLDSPNINLIYNPINMRNIMCGSDIAISSASTTSYELASIGIPSILAIQVDNQVMVATKLDSIGAMLNAGWFYDLSEDFKYKVIDFINNYELRLNMSNVCKTLVSKKGCCTIVDEIKKYIY